MAQTVRGVVARAKGAPVEVTFDRDLTYTMAPSADGKTWLISEYTGPYRLDSEALLR